MIRIVTETMARKDAGNNGTVMFKLLGELHPVPFSVKIAGNDLEEVILSCPLEEKDGFVYLSVPDQVVDGFLKMIPDRKVVDPSKASKKEYVGAHITVMYAEEYEKVKSKGKKLRELGEKFMFTLDKMFRVDPEGWDGVDEVFFISVKSPELEALRKSYGLTKRINGHDFHITVGTILSK